MEESNKWWQKINHKEWKDALENYKYSLDQGDQKIDFNKYQLSKLDDFFKQKAKENLKINLLYTATKSKITKLMEKRYTQDSEFTAWKVLTELPYIHYKVGSERHPLAGMFKPQIERSYIYIIDQQSEYYFVKRKFLVYANLHKSPLEIDFREGDIYRCDGFKGFMKLLEEM